jgi:hypothetical protein
MSLTHKKQSDSLYIEATDKHEKTHVTRRKKEHPSNEEHPVIEQIITED